MLEMMAAGHETTSNSLVWSLHVLSTHLDIQARLRKEVQGVLESNPSPDYATIESLPYLEKFFREVFRVYSPGEPKCLIYIMELWHRDTDSPPAV